MSRNLGSSIETQFLMMLGESEIQSENSHGTFRESMPRMMAGLIFAIFLPSVAIFVLVLVVLACAAIYSTLVEHQSIGIYTLLDEMRVLIGASCFISAYAIPMTIPCVALLGLPATLIGWRFRLIRWWTCVIAGFFLSSIPGGLFLWSAYSGGSSAANGVQYWINGVPTGAGLIQYFIIVLTIGLLGALGGFSFWLVWRLLTPPNTLKPSI